MICHNLTELFEEFDVDGDGDGIQELSEIFGFKMGVIEQEAGIALGVVFIDEDGTYAVGRLFPFDPDELWEMVDKDLRAVDENPDEPKAPASTPEGMGFNLDALRPDLDELGAIP